MKTFRDNISLIADIIGILAFVGLSATGIIAWFKSQGSFSWVLVGGVFAIGFVLPAILYFILKRYTPSTVERVFTKNWPEPKILVVKAYELENKLPNNQLLQQLYLRLIDHAKQWDKDARVGKISLGLNISDAGTLATLSIELVSEWKKRQAEFSIMFDDQGQSKVREYFPRRKTLSDSYAIGTPFFQLPEAWQQEVVRLYGPIEHQIKKHIHIVIDQLAQSKIKITVKDDSKAIDGDGSQKE